jgi:hypothetical protein
MQRSSWISLSMQYAATLTTTDGRYLSLAVSNTCWTTSDTNLQYAYKRTCTPAHLSSTHCRCLPLYPMRVLHIGMNNYEVSKQSSADLIGKLQPASSGSKLCIIMRYLNRNIMSKWVVSNMRPTSSFYVALLVIFMPGTGAVRLGSDQKTVLVQ